MSGGNRARGGRAEFSWDKVKEQSFSERSHYLGASVHARNERGLGNPQWYLDGGKEGGGKRDSLMKELEEVKRREKELMREALGLPPLPDERDERKEKKRERKEKKEKEKRERKEKKRERKERDGRRKDMGNLSVKK
jgi:hypothetical protein